MKYCPNCGAALGDSTVSFCGECGKSLKTKDTATEIKEANKEISEQKQKDKKKQKKEKNKQNTKHKKKETKPKVEIIEDPIDDGYDGYYNDVLPPDLDRVKEGLDKELIKKIVAVAVGVIFIISMCVVMLYLL